MVVSHKNFTNICQIISIYQTN